MQIDFGMQPNCSELVIRLGDMSRDKVVERLAAIGINEYFIEDYYNYDRQQFIPKWDGEKDPRVKLFSEFPKKVQKLFIEAWSGNDSSSEASKKLKKLGYEDRAPDFVGLFEENDVFDWNRGTVNIQEKFDGDGIAIVGHQHCSRGMFPILKKISDEFGEEVSAYDGGSIGEYEAWLENPEGSYEDE